MSAFSFTGLEWTASIRASAQMYLRLVQKLLRGIPRSPWLRQPDGHLFDGRGARLENPQFISNASRLVVEDLAALQNLASRSLNFGIGSSIGRGPQIRRFRYNGGVVGLGLRVSDRSNFDRGCFIGRAGEIRLGNDVKLGPDVRLLSESHEIHDRFHTAVAP